MGHEQGALGAVFFSERADKSSIRSSVKRLAGFQSNAGVGKYATPDALVRRSYPLVRSNN